MTPSPSHGPVRHNALLGTLLGGKYRVEGILGHGGTGHVYHAIQEPIGRSVAVKILRLDLSPEELRQFEVRFLREASQAGALQHPNVVTVHDFGRAADGTCYIVMELLRGRSLKDALKDGPLSPQRALDIFEQVLRGLRAAHMSGVVHRDVKPGNIFLLAGEDGRDLVKLLDFGLVKDLDTVVTVEEHDLEGLQFADEPSSESTVTRHGVFLGTPHYVSPEQARGGRVDGRSDLYSAGVVLYRMLTGKLPYYNADAAAIAVAHVQDPYPPMSARAPEVRVPSFVEDLVRRCMEKDPDRRWADADALLAEVAAVRRQLEAEAGLGAESSTSTVKPATLDAPAPPQPTPARARRGAIAALGLLLVGLVAAALLWPDPPPAPPALLADPAPAERSVSVFLTSSPPGAVVSWEGQKIGQTPLVWRRFVSLEGAPPTLSFAFQLEGYEEASATATLDKDEVVVNATLTALARPEREAKASARPRSSGSSRPSGAGASGAAAASSNPQRGGEITADGVPFTAAQAEATTAWLNSATEAQLSGAGIAGRQVKLIQEGRPWKDVTSFADTPFIGEKTVAAALAAAQR